jgi:hypothetical protein
MSSVSALSGRLSNPLLQLPEPHRRPGREDELVAAVNEPVGVEVDEREGRVRLAANRPGGGYLTLSEWSPWPLLLG